MVSAIAGGLSLASGLFGMIGGLRGAKSQGVNPGPGLAPQMYMLSGQEEQAAAKSEADALSRQASLAYEQSLQDAAQKERQGRAIKEEQALRMASNGITLAGSPLGVLEETRALNQQEADAIKRRGEEVSALYEAEGLQMLRKGSAAAFGGFANSLQSQFQSQVQGYQQGLQASAEKNQAIQTGISGLRSAVSGFGASSSKGLGSSLLGFFNFTQPSSNSIPLSMSNGGI